MHLPMGARLCGVQMLKSAIQNMIRQEELVMELGVYQK